MFPLACLLRRRYAEIGGALRPDRVNLVLRQQAVPDGEMGDRAVETGFRGSADAERPRADLRLHLEFGIFVFVLLDALGLDILLPQDAARRLIVRANPRFRLAVVARKLNM